MPLSGTRQDFMIVLPEKIIRRSRFDDDKPILIAVAQLNHELLENRPASFIEFFGVHFLTFQQDKAQFLLLGHTFSVPLCIYK